MDTIERIFGLKAPTAYKSSLAPAVVSNPELMLGMELEIEQLHEGIDFYIQTAGKAWNVVEDGSLRPAGRAWEFVSKPMPLNTAIRELETLFDKLHPEDECYSDRTSVHVHTNVLDFTQEQLATLCLVYTCLEDVLFHFVNFENVDRTKFPDGMYRDTNIYCVPWTQCRMNTRLIEKMIFNPGEVPRNWQKYSALNLIPVQTQGTVEWRHMHGTSNMEKLGRWLNIIGSIMQYAKNTPFEDVVRTLKQLNDVSNYQAFFQSVVGPYLNYEEEYRIALAEGCINAKFSLINWEPMKNRGAKVKPVVLKGRGLAFEEDLVDVAAQDVQLRWGAHAPEQAQAAPDPFRAFIQERQAVQMEQRLRQQAERIAAEAHRVRINPVQANPIPAPRGGNNLRRR